MTAAEPQGRAVLLAPFGRYTRYVLAHHLRHGFVIALALVSVALSIDLPPQVGKVLAGTSGAAAALRLSWFIALRTMDLFPRFIPLAIYLGVLWTEIAITLARERVLIWNTGRSTLQCLVPALMLATLLGGVQFASDAWLRPAAMAAQVREKLGTGGEAMSRTLSADAYWIALGGDLLHTRIDYGPPVVLHDLTLYRLNAGGRLAEVDNAQTAIPGASPGTWVLRDGSYWTIPPESASGPASVPVFTRATRASATPFAVRQIALRADPLWLSLWGIYPEYLSLGTLRALARNDLPHDTRIPFVTQLRFDYFNALMPGGMALLAETLSLLLFAYGAPLYAQLATLAAGFVGHLAMKTFLLMGEHAYLGPALATLLAPLGLILVSGALLAHAELRRRAGGRIDWRRPGSMRREAA